MALFVLVLSALCASAVFCFSFLPI